VLLKPPTNLVVDSSSIEVSRRARRAKTDRMDVEKLLAMLLRYTVGEGTVWRIVAVPSEATSTDGSSIENWADAPGESTLGARRVTIEHS
jgi:hypothetical protein